jgi:hypothetical protein
MVLGAVPMFAGVTAEAGNTQRTPRSRALLRMLMLMPMLILVFASTSQAAPVVMANIPDFYQHQLYTGMSAWENAGASGWCRPAAIVDALYPWQVQAAYSGLFNNNITKTGIWLGAANTAIAGVAGTLNPGGLGEINNYLENAGVGPTAAIAGKPSLLSMWYRVDPTSGNVSVALANHQFELVRKGGALTTAFELYSDQMAQGRSTLVTLRATEVGQNGLWWSGSNNGALGPGNFHTVAGAGYDLATRSILFADPDSNKGNLAANAGWYRLNPDGTPDASDAGRKAALDTTQANRYTAADGAADPPLPGNKNGAGAKYTNSDLYGTAKLNANGYTVASSDAGGGEKPATGRYTGLPITDIETISPTLSAIKGLIQQGVNKFQATFRIFGDLFSNVDEIKLFPNAALADNSFSFSLANWSESQTNIDPFGYARPFGGEDLLASSGTYLSGLGTEGDTTLDTTFQFASFDIFLHDSLTGQWLVQSVGADSNQDTFQVGLVPEPASFISLGTGVLVLGLYAWVRHRRAVA